MPTGKLTILLITYFLKFASMEGWNKQSQQNYPWFKIGHQTKSTKITKFPSYWVVEGLEIFEKMFNAIWYRIKKGRKTLFFSLGKP